METEQPLPIAFDRELLEDLLTRSDDLAEIKIVLHAIRLAARRGSLLVPLKQLLADEVLRTVAGPHNPVPAELRARQSIERALADGFVLRLAAGQSDEQTYILPHTAAASQFVEQVRSGEAKAEDVPSGRGPFSIYRPNIFALYERLIGPLTPLVAEELREAERSFPRRWIEQAMEEAAAGNKQNWRYVQSILNRWASEGRPDISNSRV